MYWYSIYISGGFSLQPLDQKHPMKKNEQSKDNYKKLLLQFILFKQLF